MFRLAKVNDLLNFRNKYSKLLYPNYFSWGLKQMGTLFVLDQITNTLENGSRLLEVGAGRNSFFDVNIGARFCLAVLDDDHHFSKKEMELSQTKRKNTVHYRGYLGDYLDDLPNDSFDCVYSVSVLEHIPKTTIRSSCDDMYRILKPGGKIFHSIDLLGTKRLNEVGMEYYNSLKLVGFQGLEGIPDFSIVPDGDAILFEPLEIVAKHYFKKEVPIYDHAVTILVSLQK